MPLMYLLILKKKLSMVFLLKNKMLTVVLLNSKFANRIIGSY